MIITMIIIVAISDAAATAKLLDGPIVSKQLAMTGFFSYYFFFLLLSLQLDAPHLNVSTDTDQSSDLILISQLY